MSIQNKIFITSDMHVITKAYAESLLVEWKNTYKTYVFDSLVGLDDFDRSLLSQIEKPIMKRNTNKNKYKPKDYVQHIATGNIFEIKKVDESKYMPNIKQYWLVCKSNSEFPSYYSQKENLNIYFKKLNPKTVKVLYGW